MPAMPKHVIAVIPTPLDTAAPAVKAVPAAPTTPNAPNAIPPVASSAPAIATPIAAHFAPLPIVFHISEISPFSTNSTTRSQN